MIEIVQSENPVLRKIAVEVPVGTITKPKIQKILGNMASALDNQGDGIAIAAPQIGISLRIFIVSGRIFDENFLKGKGSDGNNSSVKTPEVASNTLSILKECGYIPSIIITSPDSRSGRGMHLSPTSCSLWADNNNIPCLKPEKITPEFIEEFNLLLTTYSILLNIVVAYGKILPEKIISMPKLGTINIHYSLLPKYRGASPVEQSLLNGDEVTGVSIQQMEFRLDSGPIIKELQIPINIDEDKNILLKKLTVSGANMLCDLLPRIINGEITTENQDESLATYCSKIKKEDGEIDPNGDSFKNYNKYRAFSGWPGVYFFVKKNGRDTRIKITKAKYENDSFIMALYFVSFFC